MRQYVRNSAIGSGSLLQIYTFFKYDAPGGALFCDKDKSLLFFRDNKK